MPHIEVVYKKGVKKQNIKTIVNVLYSKACRQDLIWSDSLDVYARKVGKYDKQRRDIKVLVFADPYYHLPTHDDVHRIEFEIERMLEGYRPFGVFLNVEIVTSPSRQPGEVVV